MIEWHRIHGTLVRLMWRIIAPRHPRGWLDCHAVLNDTGDRLWVHCHGMERWNLPNIEFVDVPVDLGGPCHGLLMAITGYMKFEKSIRVDENVGGCMESADQIVLHLATLRRSPCTESGHDNLLRVVDLGEPVESGFPRRLLAAHLIAMADNTRSCPEQIRLLRRATEIFPGEPLSGPDSLSARGSNPGNYFAWDGLGTVYGTAGRTEEAVETLKTAVLRWPFGARHFAMNIQQDVATGKLSGSDPDPVLNFWRNVDVDELVDQYRESAKEPTE